jgi:serine/threonine protein kinase
MGTDGKELLESVERGEWKSGRRLSERCGASALGILLWRGLSFPVRLSFWSLPRVNPFAPGATIGTYRLDHQLGEGGMGTVYRATDTKLNRAVAIKSVSTNVADASARRRFQREAQLAFSLPDRRAFPSMYAFVKVSTQRNISVFQCRESTSTVPHRQDLNGPEIHDFRPLFYWLVACVGCRLRGLGPISGTFTGTPTPTPMCAKQCVALQL